MSIAYVLGGGGHMGAYEVGMLHALLERGIEPDLVVGTSVGAINGAAIANDPSVDTVDRLRAVWLSINEDNIFGRSLLTSARTLARTRTHLTSNEQLRSMLASLLPKTFEELTVHFECCAASIERASEHWFSAGPLADAILASSAVPGVLPAVEIDGDHYIDGGVVNSIPISRAVELNATEIYVLHVGRIEAPLTPPRTPVQVASVAFEIARRHRFNRDLATLPDGVTAHVLPTGEPVKEGPLKQLNYRDFKAVEQRIERAYEATKEYLG